MGIFNRVSDIISANLHEMIEKFEDPETMLKQAIREMQTTIDDARQNTARAVADEKLIARELQKNRREATAWAQRAETAVVDQNDDLARRAIRRKQEYEKVAAALREQLSSAEQSSKVLRRQLEAMQAKLADAKRRQGVLTARKRAAEMGARLSEAPTDEPITTSAFAKFDRMREKVELTEAHAEALRDLEDDEATGVTISDESVTGATDDVIEAELEALKKKIRK